MDLNEILTKKTGKGPFIINGLKELAGSNEVVGAKGLIAQSYNIKQIFAGISTHMPSGGVLGILECVTGAEDAWLNSLVSAVSPSHIRFCRPEEIIAAAAEYFTLDTYMSDSCKHTFNNEINESAREQIASLPVSIREAVNPRVEENSLSLRIKEGLFIFKHL